jgi:hypothetical protein
MNYFRIHSIILAFRYFSFWAVVPYLCHSISLIFGYQQYQEKMKISFVHPDLGIGMINSYKVEQSG